MISKIMHSVYKHFLSVDEVEAVLSNKTIWMDADEMKNNYLYESTERYPRSIQVFLTDTQNSSLHPTQKPVALLEYLIKTYTIEGEKVLDNCMGSGSTGVAAKNLNRRFIGIELEKKYFDIAEKRIIGEIAYKKIEEPEQNYKLPGF